MKLSARFWTGFAIVGLLCGYVLTFERTSLVSAQSFAPDTEQDTISVRTSDLSGLVQALSGLATYLQSSRSVSVPRAQPLDYASLKQELVQDLRYLRSGSTEGLALSVSRSLSAISNGGTFTSSLLSNPTITGGTITGLAATTTSLFSTNGNFSSLCIVGDCKTVWPSSGGSVSTSTSETTGQVPFWTSTSGSIATLGSDSNFSWDNILKKLTVTNTQVTNATTTNVDVSNTLRVGSASSNYLQVTGGATGNATTITALGSDNNVSIELVPKASSPTAAGSSGNVAINSAAIPAALQSWHNGGNPTPFDFVIGQKPGSSWVGQSMISAGTGAMSGLNSTAAWPYIEMAKMGGTVSSPTAVGTDWLLGEVAVLGHNGTTFDAHVLMDFVTTSSNARSGQIDLGFAVNGLSPEPGTRHVSFNGTENPISASIVTPNATTYGSVKNTASSGSAGWRGINNNLNFLEVGMGGSANTNALLTGSGYMLSDTGGVTVAALGDNPIRLGTNGLAASNERMRITGAGNVGIATTSPWRKFSVTGTVGFDGLTGSTGAGSLCLSASKEVVYNSGSDACLPSLRNTKHDITSLSLNALDHVKALRPVSFIYNFDTSRSRYGFIAEDASAVDAHYGTYNTEGLLTGIDDRALLALSVKAIQDLDQKISSTTSITDSSGFIENLTYVGGEMINGVLKFGELLVDKLTAREVRTELLCVGSTCITETELSNILSQSGQSPVTSTFSNTATVVVSPDETATSSTSAATNTDTHTDTQTTAAVASSTDPATN